MQFITYVNKSKPVFMYIHGECLSTFSFKKEIKELKKEFTIVLPTLHGHGDSHARAFSTIDGMANAIITYIDNHFHHSIQVLAGFSLGAQIATNILSKRPNICEYAIIESARMFPVKYRNWVAYTSSHIPTLAKQKWLNTIMYYTLFNDDFAVKEYYNNYIRMRKENIQAALHATYNYKLEESIKNATCKMAIFVGQRESKALKISANVLHEQVQKSEIFLLMNNAHGALSFSHPQEYISFVKSWVQNKNTQQRPKFKKKQTSQEQQELLPNWKHILNKIKAR